MYDRLIGNASVKASLRRLTTGGRVPHALLFTGPEGVGKREFAFEMARAMMCNSTDGGDACSSCANCKRIGAVTLPTAEKGDEYDRVFLTEHPDVGLVVPYKRILRVGAIRELEREANFRPFESEIRVFVVDDADKMNDAASNALLKTLEEPPPTTFLILITSRPDSLLATIRSRCQAIRFSPVPITEIVHFLVESHGYHPSHADLAARLSRGSIGAALSIDLADLQVRRESMLKVIENALVKKDLAALLRSSEQMNDAANKDSFEGSIGILESLTYDLWRLKAGSDPDSTANIDLAGHLHRLTGEASTVRLGAWLEAIEQLRQGLNVNINRKAATDALFVTMAAG